MTSLWAIVSKITWYGKVNAYVNIKPIFIFIFIFL